MDDLIAFVSARLDEDEAVAKAAAGCGAPDWTAPDEERSTAAVRDGKGGIVVYDEGSPDEAEHIARHDPARVLREVAAKRAILAEHRSTIPGYGPYEGEPCCVSCGAVGGDAYLAVGYPCDTVRAIAAIWSDHPDYRDEWKP